MSTFLITQTPFSNVRPIAPSIQLTRERLRNILKQHFDAEELAQIGRLFADPEPVVGAAATDWYTDYDDVAVSVSDLDAEARELILSEVGRICARIASVADAIEDNTPWDAAYLRAAIAIPDNNNYIFALGEHPVLVAWGHKLAGAGKVPVPPGIWLKSANPGRTDGTSGGGDSRLGQDLEAGMATTVVATGGVATTVGIGWLAWLLWTIFLVLFFIILWIVLSACSMGGPQSTLAQRLGLLSHCPVPVKVAQAPVLMQSDRSAILREAIREAELALAEDAQQCRVVRRHEDETRRALLEQRGPPPVSQSVAPPTEPALENEEAAIADELDDRVRDAGGQTGEMQVVLQWDGPADLDMIVSCSGGRISYNSRSSCNGGELDVDANYEVDMDRPVENIHWSESPSPGLYGLRVRNHSNVGDWRSEIPFNVLVRQGDDEQTYSGRVAQGEEVSVTDIVVE